MTVHSTRIAITPKTDSTFEHKDYFGNLVFSFAIESLHRELKVIATSDVSVAEIEMPAPIVGTSNYVDDLPWETMVGLSKSTETVPFRVMEFRFDSPRIVASDAFASYAKRSFTPGRGLVASMLDLTQRIHAEFKYDSNATDVNTTTEKAFAIKAGVCQDFAHIQIACLRSLGLPARYVSGYLRTIPAPGKARLIGADESHAWLSVYAGEKFGWIGFDPTNACFVGTQHIPMCVGRDYGDVSPMRGVVLGGGTTLLDVSVDVEPIEELIQAAS